MREPVVRPAPLHATLIAARRCGSWRGVMILGESGCGKSDLALRAIHAGWRLVADDRVCIWLSGGVAYGCAPASLTGLMEVRGLGIVGGAALAFARLSLAVEGSHGTPVERMPKPERMALEGIGADLPLMRLDLREASAVAKLERALDTAARGPL